MQLMKVWRSVQGKPWLMIGLAPRASLFQNRERQNGDSPAKTLCLCQMDQAVRTRHRRRQVISHATNTFISKCIHHFHTPLLSTFSYFLRCRLRDKRNTSIAIPRSIPCRQARLRLSNRRSELGLDREHVRFRDPSPSQTRFPLDSPSPSPHHNVTSQKRPCRRPPPPKRHPRRLKRVE